MKVKVANRLYKMGKSEFRGLLELASKQVPFGIYAVERGEYAELCKIHCRSITQLKKEVRDFKAKGFKVYKNGRS